MTRALFFFISMQLGNQILELPFISPIFTCPIPWAPLLGWGATVLDKIQAPSLHGIIRIPLLLSIQYSSSIRVSAFSMFYLNCTETVKQINRRRLSSPITKPLKGNFTKLLTDFASVPLYACKIQTRLFSFETHAANQQECLPTLCSAYLVILT